MPRTLMIAFLILCIGPDTKLGIATSQDRSRPTIQPRSLEARVHELINAERLRLKLRPLRVDDKLSMIARRHSEDMARRGFFDHVNPDGLGPNDRAQAAGYRCRKYLGTY